MQTRTTILFMVSSFLAGMLIYALQNRWIIIRLPYSNATELNTTTSHKQLVKLWLFQHNSFRFETQSLVWTEDRPDLQAYHIATAYFSLLEQEGISPKKMSVESATLGTHKTELLLSLTESPFAPTASTHQKWMIIEGLMRSLRENIPTLQSVLLLMHHQPLCDDHLDFSRPWPIKGFLGLECRAVSSHLPCNRMITIMLDPMGDAQHTGRIIEDTFERGLTLQCAQALKQAIEEKTTRIRVIITRIPGETLEPLQNAAFANRLQTDLYLTISMYPSDAHKNPVPELSLYYFLYRPTDSWYRPSSTITCEPYQQAHVRSCAQSQSFAHSLTQQLMQTKPMHGVIKPCAGIPYKPLIGMVAPACAVELGLPHKDDWQALIDPISRCIVHYVQTILS